MPSSMTRAALLFLALSSTFAVSAAAQPGAMVERLAGGAVASDRAAAGERRRLQEGDFIAVGEYVRTSSDANLVLVFADGQRLRLAPNTTLKVGTVAPIPRMERNWAALLLPPRNTDIFLRRVGETTLSR